MLSLLHAALNVGPHSRIEVLGNSSSTRFKFRRHVHSRLQHHFVGIEGRASSRRARYAVYDFQLGE